VRLRVKYYALLREQAGRSEEELDSAAGDAAALYAELRARYGFRLEREQLRVAVNAEFSEWSRVLAEDDEVVFIPPVAGG
jgi:molybdopterin converting factor subunit 1